MAKGYSQVVGFNYQETFSPVAKQTTVHLFLALITTCSWLLCQLDINNAFLNGDLEEEVYMELSQGCKVDKSVQLEHVLFVSYKSLFMA